jgi:acetyl-CoA C-acetyltransferase
MSSVALGAGMIRAGEAACVLVGGFDSMTGAPHAVHMRTGDAAGDRKLIDVMHTDGLWCSIAASGMGELSDDENNRLGIDRARQDEFALESHRRAAAATESGRLAEEIVPLQTTHGEVRRDEGIRPDTSLERLAALRPAFTPAGTITAGNASQLSDAAAAGLIASRQTAREAGLEPLAQIVGRAVVAGPDSTLHLRPAEAAEKLLAQYQLTAADIDLWEINEAFAGVALASIEALDIDPDKVNVNGGAVAVGHPLAASGFRLLLTLAIELQHRSATFGIAAMCGGGGQGEAILLRALAGGD